jgi:hypothetical protein
MIGRAHFPLYSSPQAQPPRFPAARHAKQRSRARGVASAEQRTGVDNGVY